MNRKSELLSTIAPPTPPRDNQHAEHGKAPTRPRDKKQIEHGKTAPGRGSSGRAAGSDKGTRAANKAAEQRQREPRRSHHRPFRGVPPPPEFDFDALADGTLLSEYETAQVLRGSMATLQAWRARRAVLLPWVEIAHGIRYRVADIRAYLARPRTRKYPTPPRRPRRAETSTAPLRSRATTDEVPSL